MKKRYLPDYYKCTIHGFHRNEDCGICKVGLIMWLSDNQRYDELEMITTYKRSK